MKSVKVRTAVMLLAAVFAFSAEASPQELVVYTWNIPGATDATIRGRMQHIASLDPLPHVVIMQETDGGAHFDRNVYIGELRAATGNPSWQGRWHDGLLTATSLPIVSHETKIFPYCDNWGPSRPGLRVAVDFNGTVLQVFNVHLQVWDFSEGDYGDQCPNPNPPLRDAERQASVRDLLDWAELHPAPRLIGGDFNAEPHSTEISNNSTGMASAFRDAWPLAGNGGPGYTLELLSGCTMSNPAWRIDYWFSDSSGGATPVAADQPFGIGCFGGFQSDHTGLRVRYDVSGGSEPPTNTPYQGVPANVPGLVEAEKFDEGGELIAYHDVDQGNNGGVFRTDEDVDIATTTDPPGGYTLGWVRSGEWLKYTVNVAATTNYTLDARVATPNNDGRFHVEVDGVNVTGSLTIPNTNSFETWDTVTQRGVYLTAGSHVLKFFAESTGGPGPSVGNLNYLRLTSGGTAGAFGPIAVPGIVQAEEFDPGAYHDDDAANRGGAYRNSEGVDIAQTNDTGRGYTVGWFGAQEWLSYTIDVAVTGTYTLEARVASNGTGGTFHVDVDGTDRTGPMAIPNTGGWDTWQTITKTGITLTAGQHTLTVFGDSVGPSTLAVGNLNYLRLIPGGGGGETVLLSDDFNAASLNGAEWSVSVLSGSQDPNVPVQQSGGTLNIGPLLANTSGTHYNGILSERKFNLIGGYARVQCVTPPNAGTTVATMQLTLPIDANNHYRIFVEDGHIWFEKKINGTKVRPRIPFDPVQHAFWQIRHDQATNEIVFETAPNAGGVPGTPVERRRIPRELSLDAVHVELRAGTWNVQSNPGTVRYDNVKVGKP